MKVLNSAKTAVLQISEKLPPDQITLGAHPITHPDLLRRFFLHLPNAALASMMRTCWTLYDLASPILYRSVDVHACHREGIFEGFDTIARKVHSGEDQNHISKNLKKDLFRHTVTLRTSVHQHLPEHVDKCANVIFFEQHPTHLPNLRVLRTDFYAFCSRSTCPLLLDAPRLNTIIIEVDPFSQRWGDSYYRPGFGEPSSAPISRHPSPTNHRDHQPVPKITRVINLWSPRYSLGIPLTRIATYHGPDVRTRYLILVPEWREEYWEPHGGDELDVVRRIVSFCLCPTQEEIIVIGTEQIGIYRLPYQLGSFLAAHVHLGVEKARTAKGRHKTKPTRDTEEEEREREPRIRFVTMRTFIDTMLAENEISREEAEGWIRDSNS